MMNVYPDSPESDSDWEPITLKRAVTPTRFEAWANNHKDSWYVKTLETLGRFYAPVIIEDSKSILPRLADYVSLDDSAQYHYEMAFISSVQGQKLSENWHTLCAKLSP